MAVKDGLPATDFSRMNREYIRNVAEGETVKDGLPATDFSRMNREYIKAVVEEAGGSVTVEPLSVTENGEYSEEGKAYSPVTVNVSGGGDENPFSFVPVTLVIGSGLRAVEYYGSMNYPEQNPNSSNLFPYAATFVVGDTQSAEPEEIESEITFDLPTYNGVGYVGNNLIGYPTDGDQINSASVSFSGDAEIETDEEYFYGMIKVTGECTITVTWGS